MQNRDMRIQGGGIIKYNSWKDISRVGFDIEGGSVDFELSNNLSDLGYTVQILGLAFVKFK